MNKTSIDWVKNPDGTQGFTWNPITGCLNHINGICKGGNFPCYAYRLATTRLEHIYMSDASASRFITLFDHSPLNMPDPFYPRFWPERMKQLRPLVKSTPKGIFVCDMADLFGIGVPEEWTREVMSLIRVLPTHRFYLLTKQPQNLIRFSPFPDHCYVGVTATNNDMCYEALRVLANRDYWYNRPHNSVEAKVRYLSFEPLLGRIDLNTKYGFPLDLVKSGIGWVIIGSQTKPYKPPKIEWVQEIVEAADKAGIPVFLKDNLYPLLGLGNGKSICHSNEVGTLRQEMPG